MNFVSWAVFGVMFMLGEFATGTGYLLAIGLAFVYPALGDLAGLATGTQLVALAGGAMAHSLVVLFLRSRRAVPASPGNAPDVGACVEIIEWLDECSARVTYRGEEWQADKLKSEMPDARHGVIHSVRGSRLVITTEQV